MGDRIQPRFPEVSVKLTCDDRNSYAVLGAVRREMRRCGVSALEIEAFTEEATIDDFDHLMHTCSQWVDVGEDG